MSDRDAGPTWESRFVARLEEELAAQGWSDTRLEGAMARVGYPLAAATLWKIRKGNPRRRITLDDAYGIAKALGFDSVDEFVSGKDLRDILQAASELKDAVRRLDQARLACNESSTRLYALLADEEQRRGLLATNPALVAECGPLVMQTLIELGDAQAELAGSEGLPLAVERLKAIRAAIGDPAN